MFNTTEMNLMILYNPGTRLRLMEELGNMLGYLCLLYTSRCV